MSLRQDQRLRTAVAALFCLLSACGENGETPGGTAGAGQASIGGGNTGGAGGAANGGGGSGAASGGTAQVGGMGNAGSSSGGMAQVGGMGNAGSSSGGTAGTAQGGGTLTLTSPAFDNVVGCSAENPSPCDLFPDENVSYMERPNISPELRWTGVPAGTQSFAIVLADASYGQAHWIVWNIPANVTTLAANVPQDTAMLATPAGSRQCNAIFATRGADGYFGPHVPCNVFKFELYALSISSFSPTNAESAGIVWLQLQALGDSVLGLVTLTGRSSDYMTTCQ